MHTQALPTSPPPAATVPPRPGSLLALHLQWITRLRWLAGSAVLLGGIAESTLLHLFHTGPALIVTGLVILASNIAFSLWNRHLPTAAAARRRTLFAAAWAQILTDLACLTALVVFTGAHHSPLRGFFVFHMVFASLLLPRRMAFGAALIAIGMIESALLLLAPPPTHAEMLLSAGWDVTLLVTVHLASSIATHLRAQRRDLRLRNARIRRLANTLKKQQAALVQQEKLATMGQMAAGIAHEIGNPLASMDGLLQLLERRPEKLSADQIVRLREQVSRIHGIVKQLTGLAHPDRAHPAEPFATMNLNDIVSRTLEVLRFDRRFKSVTLHTALAPNLPPVQVQPAAIEQVLLNLVINALDAMESIPQPTLHLSTLASPTPSTVALQISDNGPGIPDDIQQKIFEPFFTTKPPGKGTGLGLSITQTILRRHRAPLDIQTSPTGTTMTIQFPNVSRA